MNNADDSGNYYEGHNMTKRTCHLSNEVLLMSVDGELPARDATKVNEHLEACWSCRARRDRIEESIADVVEYRNLLFSKAYLPPPPENGRTLFSVRLRDRAAKIGRPSVLNRIVDTARLTVIHYRRSLSIAGAVLLSLYVVFQIEFRRVPMVSANELLERAEAADTNSMRASAPGVVYRKIRITAPHLTVEKELYQDAQDHRHPKFKTAAKDIGPIKSEFETAGVNWNNPLSAFSFHDWHDRQQSKTDEVVRAGDLLTLKTTILDGPVRWESFTVRERDFHPLKRTLELKGKGTFEISEVNFAVLSWSGVNDELFEPVTPSPIPPEVAATRPANALIRSVLPTSRQLDDAEINARLVINRLDADTKEQVRVRRSASKIEVKGIVETDQRKQQIAQGLRAVPNVTSSILSVEELSTKLDTGSAQASVKAYSVTGQKSPLWQYMSDKNLTTDDVSQSSHRLLDACLQLQQNSTGLSDILNRFPSPEQLSPASRAAWDELTKNYVVHIAEALTAQETVLKEAGFRPMTNEIKEVSGTATASELAMVTLRNQALCRELITGNEPVQRPALEITSDFFDSVARIRLLVSPLSLGPRSQ